MSQPNMWYTITTLSNTVLLVGCALFLWMGKETSPPIVSHSSSNVLPPLQNDGTQDAKPRKAPDGVGGVLADIMEPVRKAAVDHHEEPSLFLPSETELAAAVESAGLDSAESVVVLKILKKSYARFNMPFPSLAPPSTQPNPPNPSPKSKVTNDPKEIEAWLVPTIQRLKEEAKAQSGAKLSDSFLPSKTEQEEAILKGTFDSPEFDVVRSKLEQGYQKYQIPFPIPGQPQTAHEESNAPHNSEVNSTNEQGNTSENVAEQQIINAYFQGQLQRIKLEAKKKEEDVSDCFPSSAQIQAAVQSGSISSTESLSMIDLLEGCYQRLEIPFHPPVRK